MARLPILSKTLFYARENFPQPIEPLARQMLIGALKGVALHDKDIVVELGPASPARWIKVTVNARPCTLDLQRVDAPWSLRSTLQEAMRFAQGTLAQASAPRSAAELMQIEIAATNGMLSVLDDVSHLLDAETYGALRAHLQHGPNASAADRNARPSPEATSGAGARTPGVADVFIKAGRLGSMVAKSETKDLMAHASGHEPGGSLVVLVNRKTAAASELVAAAIKDLGRGIVLGEPTAGAGSVRVIFEIQQPSAPPNAPAPNHPTSRDFIQDTIDGKEPEPPPPPHAQPASDMLTLGLVLKTARMLTAGGAEIEGGGVQPDVQPACLTSAKAHAGEDCLMAFAREVMARAGDPQRATLLSTARTLQ